MPTAFISGISGQDGALLAAHLLGLGYQVIGSSRQPKDENTTWRLRKLDILDSVQLVKADVSKSHLLDQFKPDELYNLEGQSSVASSFASPHETISSNGLCTLDWLDAIRLSGQAIKFYQASSAEIYGHSKDFSRSEHSPLHPRSPYAVSKLFSHFMTINYREAYQLFACCGILFNHESSLRGGQFVTQKIASHVAQWHAGSEAPLNIGNIHAKRDWGHAKDFVQGMHLILQQERAEEFVLATGILHSVKDFIDIAFKTIGVDLSWEGEGLDEIAIHRKTGKTCVVIDPQFYRPTEMNQSLGNPTKAHNLLKWKPRHCFEELVEEMVEAQIANT